MKMKMKCKKRPIYIREINPTKGSYMHLLYACQKRPAHISKQTNSDSIGTVKHWYYSGIYEKNTKKRLTNIKRD